MFADILILKGNSVMDLSAIRSEASRKAWLKRKRRGNVKARISDRQRLSNYYNVRKPAVTEQSILDNFSKELQDEVRTMTAKAEAAPKSFENPKFVNPDGSWNEARLKKHSEIVAKFLSEANIQAATPAPGEQPTFITLGGRAGSGKSAFSWSEDKETGKPIPPKVKEFDSRKFLLLDSDEIKGMLIPPYEGWNAFSVHEESSQIFDKITNEALARGLNIIHDSTLNSMSKVKDLNIAKAKGYRTEGHYMMVPPDISGKRAVKRYEGKNGKRGRLVPLKVILEMKNNEKNFDAMKPLFDNWSAYDNRGKAPALIQKKGV